MLRLKADHPRAIDRVIDYFGERPIVRVSLTAATRPVAPSAAAAS